MTTQTTQVDKSEKHAQFLGRMVDAAKEKLSQANVALKSENFEEADRLIAESQRYTRMAERADRHFESEYEKGTRAEAKRKTKHWTPYIETYLTFFGGYLFVCLLVAGYQFYIDRGSFIGQIIGWGFVALLLPILFVRESRPECRDCSGRVIQPGGECPGKDHSGTDWRFVENGGVM